MISLQVEKLSKKYNQHSVIDDLTFEHHEGILGIAGSNGSGKSTLLKCLAYLLRPSSGTFQWKNGHHVLDQKQLKAKLGFAAPYLQMYTELSVIENLRFLLEASGESADRQYLQDLLVRVEIASLQDQLYGSLSTGQQQRVKLAVALVRKPAVLMLDEPGSNLDEQGHALVTSIVRDQAASGCLVLLASNDPKELELCDRTIALV